MNADRAMLVVLAVFLLLLATGLSGCGGGDPEPKETNLPVSCGCREAPPPEFCPMGPPKNCE